VAQRFAEYSGLEYAIMSGGDVAPLEDQAVTELHKLFKWVHRSKKGVLLFIDEADAFLSSRKGHMSESLRNALTTMLYHTGTPSSQFMMVLATNRPHDLDGAVLDRIDESVEFGLPGIKAREELVSLYFKKYITTPLKIKALKPEDLLNGKKEENGKHEPEKTRALFTPKGTAIPPTPRREDLVAEEALVEAARRLHGFSGREISKLMTSLQTHILFNESSSGAAGGRRKNKNLYLESKLLFEVVDTKVIEHNRTNDFQVTGYDYQNDEVRNMSRSVSPKGGGGVIGSPHCTPHGSPHRGPMGGEPINIAA